MKYEVIKRLKKAAFLFSLVFLTPLATFATTYTAVVSGNWDSALTWGGTAPGTMISGDDQIIISAGVTVNLNVDVTINNELATMTLLGTVSGAENQLTLTAGTIAGTGDLIVEQLTVGATGAIVTTGNLTCGVLESTSASLALQGSLQVETLLKLMAGNFKIESAGELILAEDATIQIEGGSLDVGGTFIAMGHFNLLYTGEANTTGPETTLGTIGTLTVQLDSNDEALTLSSSLTVTDSVQLMQGQLVLNGQSMTSLGVFVQQGNASISGDAEASLTLNGSGNVTLVFSGNDDELDTLVVSQTGGDVTLGSDLTVHTQIDLEQGSLVLDGNALTIGGTIDTQAGASITGDSEATLTVDGIGDVTLVFSGNGAELDVLTISEMDGNVTFGSDLTVYGMLNLQQGNLTLENNDLTIAAGGTVQGGGEFSFVLTNGEGSLFFFLEAGGMSFTFPVGTEAGFFPAIIAQAEGATDTHIGVSVMEGVLADGETGTDLTATASLVNHTWFVEQADANAAIDLDFEFFWSATAEVNGFDHDQCYISHYLNGAWDVSAAAEATVAANGQFSISRENITSLSPFRVTDETALAIGALAQNLVEFKTYPNPTTDYLTIELPADLQAGTVQVFDQAGNLAVEQPLEWGSTTHRLSVSDLAPGLYLIKMEGAVGKYFVRAE